MSPMKSRFTQEKLTAKDGKDTKEKSGKARKRKPIRMACAVRLRLQAGEDADHDGGEPEQEHGVGAAEMLAREPVREMVDVADPERFPVQRADDDDLGEVDQRDGEDEQRRQDGQRSRILFVVKVGEDGHDGEQVADEMAAGIAEKRTGVRKIPRQKTDERAAHEKTNGGDEVFAGGSGDHREEQGADGAEAGAKAVHVVDEIERVENGEQPQDGDGVTEENVVDEQGDAQSGSSHEQGDGELAGQFWKRAKFVFIVDPAENRDGDGADHDHGQFGAASFEAMDDQVGRGRFEDPEFEGDDADSGRKQDAEQDGQPTGQGNGAIMDFAMAGVVDQAGPPAPLPPPRKRQQRGQERPAESHEEKIEWKRHSINDRRSILVTMEWRSTNF